MLSTVFNHIANFRSVSKAMSMSVGFGLGDGILFLSSLWNLRFVRDNAKYRKISTTNPTNIWDDLELKHSISAHRSIRAFGFISSQYNNKMCDRYSHNDNTAIARLAGWRYFCLV